MADQDVSVGKEKRRKGGRFCVAGAPNNMSCRNNSYTEGMAVHQFPKDPNVRKKWVKFVQRHRVDFAEPVNKYAVLCSAHFEQNCYERRYSNDEGLKMNRLLIRGSVPTRDTVLIPTGMEAISKRSKRRLKREALISTFQRDNGKRVRQEDLSNEPRTSHDMVVNRGHDDEGPSHDVHDRPRPSTPPLQLSTARTKPSSSMSIDNKKIASLKKSNRRLRRKVVELKQLNKELKSRVVETEDDTCTEPEEEDLEATKPEATTSTIEDNPSPLSINEESEQEGSEEGSEYESVYASMEETTEDSNVNDEEEDYSSQRNVRFDPETPVYDEPKFIVFYQMLLSLFSMFCFHCKKDKPTVSMVSNGTMVTVKQTCSNCLDGFTWRSQPLVNGRYPAANLLLSFAVLSSGASISKILLVFRHMALSVYSARNFFRHQRHFLFPIILSHWESFQNDSFCKLKQMTDVVWAGDGRFDSMGHSAKYGVYTMFCSTLMKVCHFEVVQVR